MRTLLYATLARTQLLAQLQPVLGDDLIVADDPAAYEARIAEAEAVFLGDMVYKDRTAEATLQRAAKLKWVQVLTAGYDNVRKLGVPAGVQVTNIGDATAPSVALHAISLMLTMQRQVPALVRNQAAHGWDRSVSARMTMPLGQTVAVVGFGHIGRETARIARAMGARVVGVSRTGAADPGADEMAAFADLDAVVARADVTILCLPLDPATRHVIDGRRLALFPGHAILVNIARGGLVDQEALADALEAGTIGGAALDVTEPEPLPPEHRLWDAPNLYISPHVAGNAGSVTADRIAANALANLRRYQTGQPLHNLIRL